MWNLFFADLKMLVRNKQALFWSLMFPLMFTLIFGLFFGKNTTSGTIGIVNKSDSEISKNLERTLIESEIFKINKYDSKDESKAEIKKNNISAAIFIPETFGSQSPSAEKKATVIYDQGNAQVASIVNSVVDKYLTAVNYQIQNAKPIYTVAEEKVSDRNLTYFDFVLAGILGLSLMNASIMGIAIGMAKYREDKILKRITTTPIKGWWFILAEVLSRLIVNLLQISIILIVGKFFFDAHIYGNLFVILPVALVGAILFQLLGFTIASLSKTTAAAEGMATATTIPMMFLAGVFFPIDALPKWLYSIVQFLPLAPLLRIIRTVALEAASPFSDMKNVLIVLGWIILALGISIYKFRLSDE